MNIIIRSRQSEDDPDIKPHPKAFKSSYEVWETRTCSEAKFNERFGPREGEWRSKGRDHTTDEMGYVTRRMDDQPCWRIELNSIEELFNLAEECPVSLLPCYYESGENTIDVTPEY